MLSTIGCGRPYFEGLLQPQKTKMARRQRCGRPYFEGLLQHSLMNRNGAIGCGRPYFEGLLQPRKISSLIKNVVEGPILKGYYNSNNLKDARHKLWKTLF